MEKQLTVERVTTKAKVFDSGDTAWGVFSENEWWDLFQERKPEKGEVYLVDLKIITKGGRTYRNAHPKPNQQQIDRAKEVLTPIPPATSPAQLINVLPGNNVRTTRFTHPLNDYERLINRGFEIAGINGVTDDAARVSLVAILCIAYGDGKLSIDDLESFPAEAIEAGNRILANDDGWGDRDWTDGPPPAEANVMGKPIASEALQSIREMNAEMEAAKARMDKYLETVDYKTQLGAAIKTYCFNNKLDFKTNKFEVLWKCAETRNLESLSQAEAKIAIEKLKVMP